MIELIVLLMGIASIAILVLFPWLWLALTVVGCLAMLRLWWWMHTWTEHAWRDHDDAD